MENTLTLYCHDFTEDFLSNKGQKEKKKTVTYVDLLFYAVIIAVDLHYICLMGGSQNIQKKNMQAHREHSNSVQKENRHTVGFEFRSFHLRGESANH